MIYLDWRHDVLMKPKLQYNYSMYKDYFTAENYVIRGYCKYKRSLLPHIVSGTFPSKNDVGRFTGLPINQRNIIIIMFVYIAPNICSIKR